MVVIVRTQAFQAPNAVGNQTITLTPGVGLTPKAALFVVSPVATLDTIDGTIDARITMGMTDGTTHRSVGVLCEDNIMAAASEAAVRTDTANVINMLNPTTQTLQAEATFVSFGVDAVTINWSDPVTYRGYVVLFFGDELSVNVQSFASNAALNGTQDSSALGFQPDVVIGVGANAQFSPLWSQPEAMLSVGSAARLPSVTQSCCVAAQETLQNPTAVGSILRNDAILTTILVAGGVASEGARLELSFNANTYTLTTRNVGAAVFGMYLALGTGGQKAYAGVSTITTGTGDKAITDPGFRPQAVMMVGQRVGAVNTVSGAQGNISIGVGRPEAQALVSLNADDNEPLSVSQALASNANLVDVVQTDTTHDWVGSLVSLDGLGYTLNVSTAPAANRVVATLALEGRAYDHYLPPLGHSIWRRRLARM